MNEEYHLAVSDTNEEALASKISAIRRGYLKDPYAEEFATFKGNRDIIMHRGYWARVHIVRRIVENFLASSGDQKVQIVALGSGLETLWFNLMEEEKYKNRQMKFVEIDLASVVKRKIKKIEKSKLISGLIESLGLSEHRTISENYSHLAYGNKYFIHGCDLADLNQFKGVLSSCQIDLTVPTLFYCECVLSYIKPQPVDHLIKHIHDTFRLAWIFDYEMYNPNDRFGKMMVKNFEDRGCPLAGIFTYPNLEDQFIRFEKAGFDKGSIELNSMDKIYYNYIDKNERMKIQKIEMLDELEEWNIIMGHYFGLLAHSSQGVIDNEKEKTMIQSVKMKQQ